MTKFREREKNSVLSSLSLRSPQFNRIVLTFFWKCWENDYGNVSVILFLCFRLRNLRWCCTTISFHTSSSLRWSSRLWGILPSPFIILSNDVVFNTASFPSKLGSFIRQPQFGVCKFGWTYFVKGDFLSWSSKFCQEIIIQFYSLCYFMNDSQGRVSTQQVFGLSNSDLVPGKYEGGAISFLAFLFIRSFLCCRWLNQLKSWVPFCLGGLKLWEGSLDLIKALRSDIRTGLISFGGKRVLEVGFSFSSWLFSFQLKFWMHIWKHCSY